MFRFVLLSLAAVLLAAPATAQVYKWVDAAGKVHYGDEPPSTARGTKEVTATVNTLDTSGLRRFGASTGGSTNSSNSTNTSASSGPYRR